MNLTDNFLQIKGSIHFIGIGGIGMSSLAQFLHYFGYSISGSDNTCHGYVIDKLLSLDIKIFPQHQSENITSEIGLAVFSSAISQSNVELLECIKNNIPVIHRSELLQTIVKLHKNSIAITGAHGKTTTVGALGMILNDSSQKKDKISKTTVINGGFLNNINNNIMIGSGQNIVFEADDSDNTLWRYKPNNLLITNLDHEHLENYHDNYHELCRAYLDFISKIISNNGKIVYCCDDLKLSSLLNENIAINNNEQIISYGFDNNADGKIISYNFFDQGSSFTLTLQNKLQNKSEENYYHFSSKLYGKHNILNLAGAIVMALINDCKMQDIILGVNNFNGIKRRFSNLGLFREMTVIDDYAHHPVEVKASLEIANIVKRPTGKLIAVLQPHRYTRFKMLLKDFVEVIANSNVDKLIVLDIFPAGEKETFNLHSSHLVNLSLSHNIDAEYAQDYQSLKNILIEKGKRGDIVLLMGAGNITEYGKKLITESS